MEQYEKIRVLGQGSYGTAYLVRDRKSGRRGVHRVIKEIDLGRMPAAMREDARAEVDVLSSLQHVNVIAYYASFIEDLTSKLCIVMEFADGGDVAAAIKQRKAQARRFNEDEALGIFVQCCQALQHIHSRHVLHRDLKAGNIFTTKAGVVKLGDFGIAKVLDHTAGQAVTVIGTPTYLPPEVCDNKPYGIKADIWSLGVVLYELLALEPPFQGPNLAALAVKIVTMEPRVLPCDYSEDLRSLVTSCLTKQPELRPRTSELLALPVAKCGLALLPPAVVEGLQKARAATCAGGGGGGRLSSRGGGGGAAAGGWKPPVPSSVVEAAESEAAPMSGRQRREPSEGTSSFAPAYGRAPEPSSEASGRNQAQLHSVRGDSTGEGAEWLGVGLGGGAGSGRDAVDDLLRHVAVSTRTQLPGAVDGPQRGRGGGPGCSSPREGQQQRMTPRCATGDRQDGIDDRRRARDFAAQGRSCLQGGLGGDGGAVGVAGAGGQGAAAVRERAREEREAAEQEHRLALLEAAAQARRDRKAVQQKMQEMDRNVGDPGYVEVDALIRPTTSFVATKDSAGAVRQRGLAAKEEQRRLHEAELEQARRAARAAQREARVLHMHNAARLEFDMTPSSSSTAPAQASPATTATPSAAAPSEVGTPPAHPSPTTGSGPPASARGARPGRLGIAGSMLASGAGSGAAAGAAPRAQPGEVAGGGGGAAASSEPPDGIHRRVSETSAGAGDGGELCRTCDLSRTGDLDRSGGLGRSLGRPDLGRSGDLGHSGGEPGRGEDLARSGDLGCTGQLDLTCIERCLGDATLRQDGSAGGFGGRAPDPPPSGILGPLAGTLDSQADAPTLRPEALQEEPDDTLRRLVGEDRELVDELSRLCGGAAGAASAGPTVKPRSRSASRVCRPQSELSLLDDGDTDSIDNWQATKLVAEQAGATLEYSLSNDVALRSGSVGTAF